MMVSTLVALAAVGATGFTVKVPHPIPAGRVVETQDRVTDCDAPPVNFVLIVTVPDMPAWMDTGPLLDNV